MCDFELSEKGMNSKMKKVNKKILLSIIIIWIILGATVSFAMYKTNLNIQYKSNTGEMICDIIIVSCHRILLQLLPLARCYERKIYTLV